MCVSEQYGEPLEQPSEHCEYVSAANDDRGDIARCFLDHSDRPWMGLSHLALSLHNQRSQETTAEDPETFRNGQSRGRSCHDARKEVFGVPPISFAVF